MKLDKEDKLVKGELLPWTKITSLDLKEKGFLEIARDVFYHPKLSSVKVLINDLTDMWCVKLSYTFVDKRGKESYRLVWLRDVKYMYQIDNIFHGFTDRWLGCV